MTQEQLKKHCIKLLMMDYDQINRLYRNKGINQDYFGLDMRSIDGTFDDLVSVVLDMIGFPSNDIYNRDTHSDFFYFSGDNAGDLDLSKVPAYVDWLFEEAAQFNKDI